MRDMIRAIARVETQDISEADLDIYLNEGYDRVMMHQTWPWMVASATDDITLIAGTRDYTPTSTVLQVLTAVNATQDYQIRRMSLQQLIRYDGSVTSNSRPTHYFFTQGTIKFFPTPDAADTVELTTIETPAFAGLDASVPPFQALFHRCLVDWGLHRLWEVEEDFDKANEYRARFEDSVLKMAEWYNDEMQDGPNIYGERSGHHVPTNMPFLDNPAVI